MLSDGKKEFNNESNYESTREHSSVSYAKNETKNKFVSARKKNEDLQVQTIGNYLQGKSIALCVTGGIAAIETPKLARQLRRYGAVVHAYATHTALQFVGEAALEWGTGNKVVTELSGLAEHICIDDLVLVAPATLNTINGVFSGAADNVVTTLISSALGKGTPVYMTPTMHESMYKNPFLQKNLGAAIDYGIHIIKPRMDEGKAKIPKIDTIVAEVCRELSTDPLKGKKILVTGGATPVKIDSIRRITNIFKGSLGKRIALDLYHRGADVTFLVHDGGVETPVYLRTKRHDDFEEYVQNVFSELQRGYDVSIFSAAVADYKPEKVAEGKISSQGALKEIKLEETIKVIKAVREKYPELYMATFKFEDGVSQEELLSLARKRLEKYQVVVANRKQEMLESHRAHILTRNGEYDASSSKEITDILLNFIGEDLSRHREETRQRRSEAYEEKKQRMISKMDSTSFLYSNDADKINLQVMEEDEVAENFSKYGGLSVADVLDEDISALIGKPEKMIEQKINLQQKDQNSITLVASELTNQKEMPNDLYEVRSLAEFGKNTLVHDSVDDEKRKIIEKIIKNVIERKSLNEKKIHQDTNLSWVYPGHSHDWLYDE